MSTAIFKVGPANADAECNELRKHLIVWAQNQATGKRVDARISKTKIAADIANAKAETFDFMAKYLEGMEIRE